LPYRGYIAGAWIDQSSHSHFCCLCSSTMLRLPASTLRPLLNPTILSSSLRRAPTRLNGNRYFTHGIFQSSQRPAFPKLQTPLSFLKGSRTIMTGKPMVEQVQTPQFSWQRLAFTAAGVAGAVVVIDTILNRDTRDSLTLAESSLLNSTFQYTGGGLALTAIAARSLFRSGVAFRIMSANPCTLPNTSALSGC